MKVLAHVHLNIWSGFLPTHSDLFLRSAQVRKQGVHIQILTFFLRTTFVFVFFLASDPPALCPRVKDSSSVVVTT